MEGGYEANCFDIGTGVKYWMSGPKKMGGDRLYGTDEVLIDEGVLEEYCLQNRKEPTQIRETQS